MDTPENAPKTNNTFATLLTEMMSLVSELDARRRFDADVSEWLRDVGLGREFEMWRKARAVRMKREAQPAFEEAVTVPLHHIDEANDVVKPNGDGA